MLIMFSGYNRAGKDSAFDAVQCMSKQLEDTYGITKITRIALADHLKEVAYKVFGVTEDMKGTGAEEYYRMVLTKLSEVMKIVSNNEDYFSQYLLDNFGSGIMSETELYVCTDGRYLNEIEFFLNKDIPYFWPIRIDRPSMSPDAYSVNNHDFPDYRNFVGILKNTSDKASHIFNTKKTVENLFYHAKLSGRSSD